MSSSRSRLRRQMQVGALLLLGRRIGLSTAPPDNGLYQRVTQALNAFYATTLPGKIYLHLDRPYYAPGETIWFQSYAVEADSHRPDTLSKVLYVDLLSAQGRTVARRVLHLQAGRAPGDIRLPDTLAPGGYQLRAYTTWMRNANPAFFFHRSLLIAGLATPATAPAATSSRPDLQFFPEGGTLVDGVESDVGFKAVDTQGYGVQVRGEILNGQGQQVAAFQSAHRGMGVLRFTPVSGASYHAQVHLPDGSTATYPLPASQASGYALHVTELPEAFQVVVRRRAPAGTAAADPVLLLAQVRGKVAYAAQAPLTEAAPLVAHLPKNKFRPGLAHITLFDAAGVAQCERLVFVAGSPAARLTLTPNKSRYAPHEAINCKLTATDANGQPVAGEFSVAATAASAAELPAVPTIVSHLLLTSDLAGPVEDPGYYFQGSQTPEVQQAWQALLLTQGWRRFVWREIMAGQFAPRTFLPEPGLSVQGAVLTAALQPAASHTVRFQQLNPLREGQTVTDAAGRFLFRGLTTTDTARVTLFAQPGKGEKNLTVQLLAPPSFQKLWPDAWLQAAPMIADQLRRTASLRLAEQQWQRQIDQSIMLNNVNVSGRKAPVDEPPRPYTAQSAIIVPLGDLLQSGQAGQSMFQYLRGRVAGVAVSGNSISIRQGVSLSGGTLTPLYLIDGTPVTAEQFADYPIADVERIEIIKQNTAIYGSQGAGGVVAAFSRQQRTLVNDPRLASLASRAGAISAHLPGYYQAREFYTPRYSPSPSANAEADHRYATLFWSPTVRTDARGQATLTFFASDAGGEFQVAAEGLTANAMPLQGSATFAVQAK